MVRQVAGDHVSSIDPAGRCLTPASLPRCSVTRLVRRRYVWWPGGFGRTGPLISITYREQRRALSELRKSFDFFER